MSDVFRPQTFEQAYPGRFLSAGQLPQKPLTLTIADVVVEQLDGENGTEPKVVLTFRECSKATGQPIALVLAKINARCVAAMFGKAIAGWIGKRIALFATDQIMPYPAAKADDRYCIRIYGSPDIERDLAVQIKMPRRKPVSVTLRSTRKDAPQATHTVATQSGGTEGASARPAASEAPSCPSCRHSIADLPQAAQDEIRNTGLCPACPTNA